MKYIYSYMDETLVLLSFEGWCSVILFGHHGRLPIPKRHHFLTMAWKFCLVPYCVAMDEGTPSDHRLFRPPYGMID